MNESNNKARAVRDEFKALPIASKIATLIEMEGITMAEGLETIAERSISFGKKIVDTIVAETCTENENRKSAGPAEEK